MWQTCWVVVAVLWRIEALRTSLVQDIASCMLNYSLIQPKTLETSILAEYGEYMNNIGSGSSATVSTYRRYSDNKVVAMKEYTLSSCHDVEIQEIKLEYFIGTLLSDVPGIVPVLDLLHIPHSCQWYLVTECIPLNLVGLLTSLSTQDVTTILLNLEQSMHDIHTLGVSHGDVKLENVLLTTDHKPLLIDFGSSAFHLCRVDSLDAAMNVVPGDYGTPAYLPPEVFTSLEYDRTKADLWALGVLANVMFMRELPWKVASLGDERFRAFVGVEVEGRKMCRAFGFEMGYPICILQKAAVVEKMPENIREAVGGWLEVDPFYRTYSVSLEYEALRDERYNTDESVTAVVRSSHCRDDSL